MENAREARRRKILERGSDRLALITGQGRSVPDSSPPPPPSPLTKEDDPRTSISPFSGYDATNSHFSNQYGSNKDTSGTTAAEIAGGERSNGISRTRACNEIVGGKKDEISICESRNVADQNDRDSKLLNPPVPQKSSDQVVDTVESKAREKKQILFSSKQVSHSVSTSENTRLLFAVAIALLVILSNHGYSLGGASSIINFRPLFLVMLSDITIVLGLLMTTQARVEKVKEKGSRTGKEEYDSADDALEAFLMFQKAARAVFMDCSICAAIMICGLCN
ncbi:hypothetical protein BHM03_00027173 [Ensete ventricosum]|uniref:Uncharacterized protein n=1 Tax=Ensete ventricosum TaxID=4639 RepID=A0A445MHM6_ENSVE|nr:hypothetical protein BHM03_00027173 [Ensete ventricosum]